MVTVIAVVFCPAVIVQPEGTVHIYEDAPLTALILYVCPVAPGVCDTVPVIVPGVEGVVFTVIDPVFVIVPQPPVSVII